MRSKWFIVVLSLFLTLVICSATFGGVTEAKGEYDAVVVVPGDNMADFERPD